MVPTSSEPARLRGPQLAAHGTWPPRNPCSMSELFEIASVAPIASMMIAPAIVSVTPRGGNRRQGDKEVCSDRSTWARSVNHKSERSRI